MGNSHDRTWGIPAILDTRRRSLDKSFPIPGASVTTLLHVPRRLRSAPVVITVLAAFLTAPAHAATTTGAKTSAKTGGTKAANRSTATKPTPSACDQGRYLNDLGRPADATSAYLKGLATAATAECSKKALDAFNTSAIECGPATALEGLDRDKDANAAYRKVLATRPASTCAVAGATRTGQTTVREWLTQATTDVGTVTSAVAIGFVLLILLCWLVLIPLTRCRRTRDLWLVRNFRRVRVQIKPLDDSLQVTEKLGASTTGLLRARLRADAGDARFDQASGSASAADALDGLGDAAPQAKIIIAFIKILRSALPKRDWVITGELQGAGDHAEGLSLAIDNGGTFIDFAAFWAATMAGPASDNGGPPTGPEAYHRLVVPAAGWLTYHIAAATNPDDLPTTNALSSALTQCGVYWYDQGRPDVARGFYQRALGYDNRNSAALANLGFLDGLEEALEQQAEDALNEAQAIVEGA